MVVRAQQGDRMRRIGVLMPFNENDPQIRGWFSGLTLGLAELGWTDGGSMRWDVRWAGGDLDRMRTLATELVDQRPDVIFTASTPATAALQRATRTIPIVFVLVDDPVGNGFIASERRPGGNITGFINFEPSLGGKWLELLSEFVPGVTRVAIIFNPDTAPGGGAYILPSFEAAARSLKVRPIVARVRTEAEIASTLDLLGREPRGGLVVMPDIFAHNHREFIVSLAARTNVPVVYFTNSFARDGGLLSYGPNYHDIFHHAAPYVDRILRGAKPTDLPVQLPVKFEMVLNVKTAKALGLAVPQSILLRADEVIE
jgi:putative ABC transport system substrate-binding protein